MSRFRVADLIARRLRAAGVDTVFMVTGGGAMHLNDAFAICAGMRVVFCHHEQACAMAAEGYARVAGRPAVVSVTTGPGGINALNGVFGAYTDSIPMIVISGQVKRETLVTSYDLPGLRQLGDQEVDIVRMASGVTKLAVQAKRPEEVPALIDHAAQLAVAGRPGPTWIDVPIDVQGALVDDPEDDAKAADGALHATAERLSTVCREIAARLQDAARPVIMVGSGVRLAGALDELRAVVERLNVPLATAWTAIDAIESDHPLYCGRPGTIGDRAGNFAVQNADVLLVIGCRLNIRQVSYNWKAFARHAWKIQVDVDPWELAKPTVRPDLPVESDARVFLEALAAAADAAGFDGRRHDGWAQRCRARVARYPAVLDRHRDLGHGVNPYYFVERLFAMLDASDVVVCGNGSACVVTYQAATIRRGQQVFCNSGDASMGYDLPAAIGAAVARAGRRVICIAGDGSVQMNVQELQTLTHSQLPVKVFVLNNNGYLSMKMTQRNFFKRLVGADATSGISFPDMVRLAEAYDLPAARAEGPDFEAVVRRALDSDGPFVCEVMLDPAQEFEPKLAARALPDGRMTSPALEDMSPFLSRAELMENLEIPPWEEG